MDQSQPLLLRRLNARLPRGARQALAADASDGAVNPLVLRRRGTITKPLASPVYSTNAYKEQSRDHGYERHLRGCYDDASVKRVESHQRIDTVSVEVDDLPFTRFLLFIVYCDHFIFL